jgi:hypothetical protein
MSAPRRRDALLALAAAGGALVLALTVVLAKRAFREAGRPVASSPPVEPPSRELCTSTEKRYHEAWEARNQCTADADCVATRRGELFTGLDGCARFGPRTPDTAAADAVGAEWLAAGCASSFEICGEHVPEAHCREGVCDEVPPAPLPRSWQRVGVGRGFRTAKGTLYAEDRSEPSFEVFMPPGLIREDFDAEGGISSAWSGPQFRLYVSYDFWAPDAGRPADALSSEAMTVGGNAADLFVTRYRGRDGKAAWTAVQLIFARHAKWPGELAIRAVCKKPPPCPEGELAVRSVVFRGH